MAEIKLDFNARDYRELADFAEGVRDATTGNADFPLTATRVGVLGPKSAAVRSLVQTRDEHEQVGKKITQQLKDATKDLKNELRAVCGLAQGEVSGDATKLLGGGWDLTDPEGKPQGTLPAPENFHVTYGDEFRELDFMFDSVKGATGYKLQLRPQGTDAWQSQDIPRGTKFSLPEMPGGALEFRLCAQGTAGNGEWSPIVSKKLG
ncbi:MAG: fibronectin type III domain-containing protein [Hymenobacteraceae bacterium]|nr:fibronectin type III domain-containing protein [Hymenobacteraceae bacterium]